MKRKLSRFLALMVITGLISSTVMATPSTCGNGWNCYKKAVALSKKGEYQAAVKELEAAIKAIPGQASFHNELAKNYEKLEKYQLASEQYAKQAAIYQAKGEDVNSYLGAQRKADELSSTIEFYELKQASAPSITLQKYEPEVGAYIGAFISKENKYNRREYTGPKGANEFLDFNELLEKKHATFFDYSSVGYKLNQSLGGAEQDIVEAEGALHIGYEPLKGLDEVTETAVREYAKELGALNIPIFLRYASEMNGQWAPWNGDPTKYIEKWRMVHDVFEQEAPNVAMVWSPAEVPLNEIDKYYPGDNYVDWVGLSIYSAQFENGDITKTTDQRNPLSGLDYVYNKYANRKPIMISEYGASHQAGYGANKQDTTKFAIAKMTYFYENIRIKYPRVKCIQWYSANNYNIKDTSKNRVNYSLLENEKVFNTYKRIISNDYFLSNIVNGPGVEKQTTFPMQSKKVTDTIKVHSDITLATWIKSYDLYISQVVYKLGNVKIATVAIAPYQVNISYDKLKVGMNQLEAAAFDSKGRVIKTQSIKLQKS